MAFTVEDGTGKADANSYASVEFADAYFTDRAITAWTGASGVKQSALIRATDYIDQRWGSRFVGSKQFPDTPQALEFPRIGYDRNGVELDDTIPVVLKKACAEYALRALTATLAPDLTVDASGRKVLSSRSKVGPIETETTYSEASVSTIKPYPAADMLMKSITVSTSRLIRC